jgi:hypothetical protein
MTKDKAFRANEIQPGSIGNRQGGSIGTGKDRIPIGLVKTERTATATAVIAAVISSPTRRFR